MTRKPAPIPLIEVLKDWPEATYSWPLTHGLPPERTHDGGPLDFGRIREDHNSVRLFPEGWLPYEALPLVTMSPEKWRAVRAAGAASTGQKIEGHQHEARGRTAEERIASIPDRGWVIHEPGEPLRIAFGPCPLDSDADGNCHACVRRPEGCVIRSVQARALAWSAGLEDEV